MKNALISCALLAAAPLVLTACGEEPPAEEGEPQIGLEVSNARLILPAVAGNPAAVYFDITHKGDRGVAIRSAFVDGAESAELHEYVEYDFQNQMVPMMQMTLQPGESESLEPGGRHVMATNIADTIKAGDKVEVTLTIAGGDKHTFEADVLPANAPR